jgi:hypothetical protein
MKLPLAPPARALALIWAGFWMVFILVESAVWHTPVPLALPWVGVALLFVISALVPLRWEGVGAFLLIVVGLSAGIANSAFGAPPVASGILLWIHHHSVTARA